MRNANTLVAIAGHATFLESVNRVPDDPTDERNWYLQTFQEGEVGQYINHMRRGSELVASNPTSLGLMSGGRTRRAGGLWSEASTYLAVADAFGYWQGPNRAAVADVRNRFGVEALARDSLENVLFSVMRFRRQVGKLPLKVMMVGWELKEERFAHHARTLGIPDNVFTYEGVPVDAYGGNARSPDMGAFAEGEQKALKLWTDDPLGDSGELLDKRNKRNPFGITPDYTWREYVAYTNEQDEWRPSREVLDAAAIEGAAFAS